MSRLMTHGHTECEDRARILEREFAKFAKCLYFSNSIFTMMSAPAKKIFSDVFLAHINFKFQRYTQQRFCQPIPHFHKYLM